MPAISVIIPTYNAEKTIGYCLSSLISQSFENFEILVLDGLSSDDTVKIAKSFNDERVKIFSEKDEGIYDAMNKGIKLALGEWLYFLGSDDILFNNQVFREIYQHIETTPKKVVYGNILIDGDCSWAANGQIYDGQFSLKKLFSQNIPHQATFYHKIVFKKIGNYNPVYKICADYDLNLKAASVFEFEYIDIIISKFKAGGASSQIFDYTFITNLTDIILKHYKRRLNSPDMGYLADKMIQAGKRKIKQKCYLDAIMLLQAGYFHKLTNSL